MSGFNVQFGQPALPAQKANNEEDSTVEHPHILVAYILLFFAGLLGLHHLYMKHKVRFFAYFIPWFINHLVVFSWLTGISKFLPDVAEDPFKDDVGLTHIEVLFYPYTMDYLLTIGFIIGVALLIDICTLPRQVRKVHERKAREEQYLRATRAPVPPNQQQYQAPTRTYNPPPPMPYQGPTPTGAVRQPNTQPTPPTNKGYSIFEWLKK